ncbi:hypothetical protein EN850_02955 [Mesorhizobium sp. M8A.F.Ca.ET.207.01.1.1]|uniref:hypothetical protein n=1 Tax=Mesorhizobium sp. M8A.F.Ca.ET.207.01.1.1 TaxID=2563968 RepID=UPI00109C9A6C|nr:hypothetical protein [Mesorhizobium sp. M8A.F.Ca.ET.207.01.1.1]TGQ83718.1 hypothetical protein EN850_02955 [Mesorhizobium sp. M8A.F.Ca.ET.207.01.1.1]
MKKIRFVLLVLSITLGGFCSTQAANLADILDGMRKSPYGITSDLAIGDSVDAIDPSKPKERCLDNPDGNVKQDTQGAVHSTLSFKFIKDINEFQNELKVDYSAEASSSANLGKILGGNSTIKNFGHFENFLKNDSETALIIIEAEADHGRDLMQDFTIRDEFKKYLNAKDYKEFRKHCGTHFVRGWTRKSSISVVYELSNIDREAKVVLNNTFSYSGGANFDVKVLSGDAKASASTTLADTLALAQRLGKVTATVDSAGGGGIATNLKAIVSAGDPTKKEFIDTLLTKMAEASTDFTYANSAPDTFLFTPWPQLDFTVLDFNANNYEKLGKIYKYLLRVDQRLATYEDYKAKDVHLWEQYFRVNQEELSALRNQLVVAYSDCRNSGSCDFDVKNDVDGLILDDVLVGGKLDTKCLYANTYADQVSGKIVESGKFISSIVVVWDSKINFLHNVDVGSMAINAVTPEFDLVDLKFEPEKRQSLRPDPDGNSGLLYLDVYRQTVDPRDVTQEGKLAADKVRDMRDRIAQTVFVSHLRTLNGMSIEEVLGRPEMTDCPAFIPDRH